MLGFCSPGLFLCPMPSSFVPTHCLALPSIPSGFHCSGTGCGSPDLWMSCLSSELPSSLESVPKRPLSPPTHSQLIAGSSTGKCPNPSRLLLLRPNTYHSAPVITSFTTRTISKTPEDFGHSGTSYISQTQASHSSLVKLLLFICIY